MSGKQTIRELREYLDQDISRICFGRLPTPLDLVRIGNFMVGLERELGAGIFSWVSWQGMEPRNCEDFQKELEELFKYGTLSRSVTFFNGRSSSTDLIGIQLSAVGGDVTLMAPSALGHCFASLLEIGGETLRPYYCHWSPPIEAEVLRYQLFWSWQRNDDPYADQRSSQAVLDFPSLQLPRFRAVVPAEITTSWRPGTIGWINYWSPDTCQLLGFPDNTLDSQVLPVSHRTSTGAWLVKLSEDPLDFEQEEHRNIIRWAFDRFREVGKRI